MRGTVVDFVPTDDPVQHALRLVRDMAQLSTCESGRQLLGRWGMLAMLDALSSELAGRIQHYKQVRSTSTWNPRGRTNEQ